MADVARYWDNTNMSFNTGGPIDISGDREFWGNMGNRFAYYQEYYAKSAEKQYVTKLDLLQKQTLNALAQKYPGDPEGLAAEMTAVKKGLLENIPGNRFRNEFNASFEINSMPIMNKALADKQRRMDDEYAAGVMEALHVTTDGAMKLVTDAVKGDVTALAGVAQARTEMMGQINSTYADGSYVFSPEARARQLQRFDDDWAAAYATNYVESSRNKGAAVKQFKDGALNIAMPGTDGALEEKNVRGMMSFDTQVRMDKAMDAYMRQLETQARIQRLELLSRANDIFTASALSGDYAPAYRLADMVGGKEGARLRAEADAKVGGLEMARTMDGLASFADKKAYLDDVYADIEARAKNGDPEGLALEYAIYEDAGKKLNAVYQEALKDPGGYAHMVVSQNFAAVNAGLGEFGIEPVDLTNVPLTEAGLDKLDTAAQIIFGPGAKIQAPATQIAAVQQRLSQATDAREQFEILGAVLKESGGYAPIVAKQLKTDPAIVALTSVAGDNPQMYNISADIAAAMSIPDNALPDTTLKDGDFRAAFDSNPSLSVIARQASLMPGNDEALKTFTGLSKGLKNKAVLDGNMNVYDNFNGLTGVNSSNVVANFPSYYNISPFVAENTLNSALLLDNREILMDTFRADSYEPNAAIRERKAREAFDSLIVLSAPAGQGYFYVFNPITQRAVTLKDGTPLTLTNEEFLQEAQTRFSDTAISVGGGLLTGERVERGLIPTGY